MSRVDDEALANRVDEHIHLFQWKHTKQRLCISRHYDGIAMGGSVLEPDLQGKNMIAFYGSSVGETDPFFAYNGYLQELLDVIVDNHKKCA